LNTAAICATRQSGLAGRRNAFDFGEFGQRLQPLPGFQLQPAHPPVVVHPEHAEFDLRLDVMLIAPRHLPRHLLAAFDAST